MSEKRRAKQSSSLLFIKNNPNKNRGTLMLGTKIIRIFLFTICSIIAAFLVVVDSVINLIRAIVLSINAPDGFWFIVGYMHGYYKELVPRVDDMLYRIRTGECPRE